MNLDVTKDALRTLFADTYFEARRKFLAVAPEAKAYLCSAKGPGGEALSTDIAWHGPADARKVLVLVSATHGAEGYLGSASQIAFLKAGLHERLPPSTAVLLVHALNCWGMAWDFQSTAEGVNLNRNFIDFSKPVPENPGFEEIATHLVPEDMSPAGLKRAEEALAAFRARVGEWPYQKARKGGQYTRPGGMLYGGKEPTEARRVLEQAAQDYGLASREEVVIIDYHSGIGPYGYGEPQCEQPSGLDGYARAQRIFGVSVTSPDVGNSSSVAIVGSQDDYWERLLGDRHTYIAIEYGTYGTDNGRERMRDELWLFSYRPDLMDAPRGREIRSAVKTHWYPQHDDWKEMVTWRSHQLHRQALAHFS
jgi:hypothetical protein